MKTTLIISTLAVGLALTGCNKSTRTSTASTDPATTTPADSSATATASTSTTPSTTATTSGDTLGAKIDRAGDRVSSATRSATDDIKAASREAGREMREMGRDVSARMTEWRLSAADIDADVRANRAVVRTRSDAVTPTGNIDDDTIESAIKGRLQADPKLADLRFDVNANKRGEVELEGKARTTDEIAHAMATALDTDGVTKVTSKIKLDADAGARR